MTRHVLVRYRLKPECVALNEALVRDVFAQLAREQPEGLRYATWRQPDGVTFVHLAVIETVDGSNPLTSLATFTAFTREIRDRCVEPPVTTNGEPIGSYRLPGD